MNRNQKITQHGHICNLLPTVRRRLFRSKCGDQRSVVAPNFEVASCSSFRDLPKGSLCDGEVGGGSGGVTANSSRPETADDVIFGTDVEIFQDDVCVNLLVARFSGFRGNLNQPLI